MRQVQQSKKKRTGEIKRDEKVKGNICRSPNEMTVIHILSKTRWNAKQILWAVNLTRQWSYKYIIQSAQVMSISWAWQTDTKCCQFQFTFRYLSVNLYLQHRCISAVTCHSYIHKSLQNEVDREPGQWHSPPELCNLQASVWRWLPVI